MNVILSREEVESQLNKVVEVLDLSSNKDSSDLENILDHFKLNEAKNLLNELLKVDTTSYQLSIDIANIAFMINDLNVSNNLFTNAGDIRYLITSDSAEMKQISYVFNNGLKVLQDKHNKRLKTATEKFKEAYVKVTGKKETMILSNLTSTEVKRICDVLLIPPIKLATNRDHVIIGKFIEEIYSSQNGNTTTRDDVDKIRAAHTKIEKLEVLKTLASKSALYLSKQEIAMMKDGVFTF